MYPDAPRCYRVQFDQQLLGVELVQDIHLAAAEPLENLPPALAEVYQVLQRACRGGVVRVILPPSSRERLIDVRGTDFLGK